MPAPNEHVCDIKSYKDFERVRREPEDYDSPMRVGGKRVYRLFGFGGEGESGVSAYYFPRKHGWADATETARSWCDKHGGTFHAMTGKKAAVFYIDEGPAISMVEATTSRDGGTVWHELVPMGDFDHPEYGEFNITEETIAEMIERFNSGAPVAGGIPIDEKGDHSMRAEGAYGWIRSLEARDNSLWGEIQWTPDGVEAVDSKRFKYISPRFFVGETNFIKAAALCTRPFFNQQPELQVAASEYIEVENQPRQETGHTQTLGGTTMALSEKDARSQYEEVHGELSDEAWKEVTDGMEDDWDAFVANIDKEQKEEKTGEKEAETGEQVTAEDIKALEDELAQKQKDLEQLQAQKGEAVAAVAELTKRVEGLEQDKKRTEIEAEVAATQFGDERYSPAAIKLLTGLQMGDDGAVKAIQEHLEAHQGQFEKIPVGEFKQLTATTETGEEDEETWFANHPMTESTRKRVKEIATSEQVGLREAYTMHIDRTLERR